MSLSPFFDRRRVKTGDNGGDRLAAAVAAIGERWRQLFFSSLFFFSSLLLFSSSLLILHRNTAVLLIIGLSCLWSLRFSESKLPQNEVEHERLVEAYSVLNQKLKHSLSEQTNLERTIQKLKADSRRCEQDYSITQKEIVDLQKQVTIIIKECRDVQLRCGSVGNDDYADDSTTFPVVELNADSDVENIISERLHDIRYRSEQQ